MKRIILAISMMLSSFLFACDPSVTVKDLKNGTVEVTAFFPAGDSIEGVQIHVLKDKPYNGDDESIDGKEILYTATFDSTGKLILPKPKTKKYVLFFDGGPGHDKYVNSPVLTEEETENWMQFVSKIETESFKEKLTRN